MNLPPESSTLIVYSGAYLIPVSTQPVSMLMMMMMMLMQYNDDDDHGSGDVVMNVPQLLLCRYVSVSYYAECSAWVWSHFFCQLCILTDCTVCKLININPKNARKRNYDCSFSCLHILHLSIVNHTLIEASLHSKSDLENNFLLF